VQDSCLYYVFKTIFSGHNKHLGAQTNLKGHCPRMPPVATGLAVSTKLHRERLCSRCACPKNSSWHSLVLAAPRSQAPTQRYVHVVLIVMPMSCR